MLKRNGVGCILKSSLPVMPECGEDFAQQDDDGCDLYVYNIPLVDGEWELPEGLDIEGFDE